MTQAQQIAANIIAFAVVAGITGMFTAWLFFTVWVITTP